MRSIYKTVFVFLAFATTAMLTKCSDESSGGQPTISYIRVTDPASSDSLLVAAGQGQMVAVIGRNLQHTRQVWFNDQPAALTATFITSTSIIARVPSQIPEEITNEMKLVFANGESLTYDFTIDISKPTISRMKSEYVNTGEVATFYGDYFYEPVVVTFTGGVEGELVSVEDQVIGVKVPDGAQPGPVTITTNFGETETDFWFHDNRNIVASFDGTTNGLWHGPSYIVSSDEDIPVVDGKFIRMNRDLGAWAWFELYVGPSNSDVALELKNIPADAFANPEDYNLKFEINTLASLTGATIRLYIGPDMPGERGSVHYIWQPNIDTGGEWETIAIPWADVYAANNSFAYNPDGYGISFHFSGPSPVNANFGLDNMRVVPKTND